MKIKPGFALKAVDDTYIVVPVDAQTADFRCILTLNETGALLWKQLENDSSEAQLVDALLAEYDVASALAQGDVAAFVAELRENDLLEE